MSNPFQQQTQYAPPPENPMLQQLMARIGQLEQMIRQQAQGGGQQMAPPPRQQAPQYGGQQPQGGGSQQQPASRPSPQPYPGAGGARPAPTNAPQTRAQFIDQTYRQYLGRPASPEEMAGYTAFGPDQIVAVVSRSQEAQNAARDGKNAYGEPFGAQPQPYPGGSSAAAPAAPGLLPHQAVVNGEVIDFTDAATAARFRTSSVDTPRTGGNAYGEPPSPVPAGRNQTPTYSNDSQPYPSAARSAPAYAPPPAPDPAPDLWYRPGYDYDGRPNGGADSGVYGGESGFTRDSRVRLSGRDPDAAGLMAYAPHLYVMPPGGGAWGGAPLPPPAPAPTRASVNPIIEQPPRASTVPRVPAPPPPPPAPPPASTLKSHQAMVGGQVIDFTDEETANRFRTGQG